MPQPSFAPWDRITRTHPTHRLKSQGGSLTSQTEILGGCPREEGGHHHAPRDHPQAVEVEVAVEVAVAEEAGAVEVEEEHSHCPDTHLPSQLKSF